VPIFWYQRARFPPICFTVKRCDVRLFLGLNSVVAVVLWASTGLAQGIDLTGIWHTRTGATFFVRQLGSEIWWFGTYSLALPTPWTHVASGRMEGNVIRVRWVDVPQGLSRNSGTLGLKVVAPDHLVVVENPNDFSADWIKQGGLNP
jgi:hypothetical protein